MRVDRNRETYAKRGPLAILRDPTSNEWKKFWFVLRRPYLHLYSSSGEIEEVAVINISTVRVEQSPEIEQMLDVSSVVTVITSIDTDQVPRWLQ